MKTVLAPRRFKSAHALWAGWPGIRTTLYFGQPAMMGECLEQIQGSFPRRPRKIKLGSALEYILQGPDSLLHPMPGTAKSFHKVAPSISYPPPAGQHRFWDNIDIFCWLKTSPMQIKGNFFCAAIIFFDACGGRLAFLRSGYLFRELFTGSAARGIACMIQGVGF